MKVKVLKRARMFVSQLISTRSVSTVSKRAIDGWIAAVCVLTSSILDQMEYYVFYYDCKNTTLQLIAHINPLCFKHF